MSRNNVQIESTEQRFARYQNALSQRQLWQPEFDQAYRWLMPNRLPLIETDTPFGLMTDPRQRGDERVDHIFDPTGMESLMAFANNIQMNLMPPYTQWAQITAADGLDNLPAIYHERFGNITPQTINQIKQQLQEINRVLFTYFENSRLYSVINEAFQDLGITMGVLLINEGNLDNPIVYDAIPANQVVIENDSEGKITNVWRPISINARLITEKWPNANIPSSLQEQINKSPNQPVKFIEGTITYPNNPPGKRYYYFVMLADGKTEILTEWRDYFPWIVFRWQKSPGEMYGRGPALTALPFVRQLNKLAEFFLRGLQMQSYPVFVASSGMFDINPYTLSIEPGSIIEAAPGTKPSDAITSLTGATPTLPFQYIQILQQQIKEIMFANPINVNVKTRTATEAQIINNNWVQKNAGFFSRLSLELIPPLVDVSLHLLTKKGILPKLDINGHKVGVRIDNILLKLEYMSPLAQLQNERRLQTIDQAVQFAMQTFGGIEGLLTMNIGLLPEEVYELLNIPEELINYDFKDSPLVNRIQQAVNGNPQNAPTQPMIFGNQPQQ